MARATIETIWKLKLELLSYPSYSPDLTPSDYHIFELLRVSLHGCQFANDEVKDTMHNCKHFSQRTAGRSLTEVKYVWRS
jgi:hypothetical protein